jgi:hypothetical protein
MSVLTSDPPFGRGSTLGVKDVTQGNTWIGTMKVFTDANPHDGTVYSNREVRVVCLRNRHTDPLLPGQLVTCNLEEATGLAAAGDLIVAVVDEYLPASGVAVDDVFYGVVTGPTQVNGLTASTGDPVGVGAGGDAAAGAGLGVTLAETDAVTARTRTLVGVHYNSAASGGASSSVIA